ncbi:cytidine deaminase [Bacteroidia bacterium]|nr:cytidine deaminase [Bacteroidia bacterium]
MSEAWVSFSDLSTDIAVLLRKAQSVSVNAYNAYSKFRVGAAALTKSGAIYEGAFLENASLGLSICAEPAAIMNANTNGDFNISAIAIVGGNPQTATDDDNPVTPCGRCRQIIYEASTVSNVDIAVYCANLKLTKVLQTTISQLLPFPFNFTEQNNPN